MGNASAIQKQFQSEVLTEYLRRMWELRRDKTWEMRSVDGKNEVRKAVWGGVLADFQIINFDDP